MNIVSYDGPAITEEAKLHERVKRWFRAYLEEHPEKTLMLNDCKLLKVAEFEGFVSSLAKLLDSRGYLDRFERLRQDLSRVRGLFPISFPKSFDKAQLYLEFVFTNQRGVHEDDLEMIFKIMKVESYSQVALTRGFTMLVKESDSTRG